MRNLCRIDILQRGGFLVPPKSANPKARKTLNKLYTFFKELLSSMNFESKLFLWVIQVTHYCEWATPQEMFNKNRS